MTWLQNNLLKFTLGFFLIFGFFYFRIIEINRPLWADEIITIKTLDINPLTNPLYNGISTNLPLFYYLVKIFSLILPNISPRYLCISLSFISLVFLFFKYEKMDSKVKGILLLFLAFSPIQIYYSIELRTYILAQLLIIINYYYFSESKLNKYFWLTGFLLILTHYSCYIYLLSIFLIYFLNHRNNVKTIINFIILGLFGIVLVLLISKNSGFSDSTQSSILNGNFSRLNPKYFLENALKLREVITIYYNFGLHYYRVENNFLSIFKKITQVLFLTYLIILTFKKGVLSSENIKVFLLFSLLMFFSILFDQAGVMPFGGRHIFPFQFFYLIFISQILTEVFKKSRVLSLLIIVFLLSSYFSYDYCLSKNLGIFTGNNDPQGILFSECIK
jgi:hypothetical protein